MVKPADTVAKTGALASRICFFFLERIYRLSVETIGEDLHRNIVRSFAASELRDKLLQIIEL